MKTNTNNSTPAQEVTVTVSDGQASFAVRPIHHHVAHRHPSPRHTHAHWLSALIALVIIAAPSQAQNLYTANDIIQKTNSTRSANGVPSLTTDATLTQAANMKAQDMIANGYFSHTSPAGITPWSWFSKAGYAYTEAGENLAKDFASADGVIQGWMGSATHKKNLLSTKFSDIGVAVVDGNLGGQQTILVVQFFGNQKIASALPPPAPEPAPTPEPVPTPAPVAPTPPPASAPASEPIVAEPRLSSLVHADGVPLPNLQFTYQEPDPAVRIPVESTPQVAGAQDEVLTESAGFARVQRDLPVLMLLVFLIDVLAIAAFTAIRPKLADLPPLARLGFRVVPVRLRVIHTRHHQT